MTAPTMLLEWNSSSVHGRRHRRRQQFAVLLSLFALMSLTVPAGAAADVLRWAGADDREPTDAIVVLGAAQYQGAPSPVLANRLAHAQELIEAGVSDRIITVGGFQTGDVTSEAQTGKEELVADGLDRDQVIALPFGANTVESMHNVAAIAAQEGITSVTLVTDPAHSARALAVAERAGLVARVSPTHSGPGSALTGGYLLRESAGLVTVWLGRN